MTHSDSVGLIWSIAELLRGDYKQSDYGKVILPLTVLRRLDCVLENTKEAVLAKWELVRQMNVQNIDPILNQVAGYNFHNHSPYTFNRWQDLSKLVISNQWERKLLLQLALRLFKLKGKVLLGDREYIGSEWFGSRQALNLSSGCERETIRSK